MATYYYSRGKDGVTRESVSYDGGKTRTQTGANSSNGYSGSSAGKSSGGSTSYSGNTGGTSKYEIGRAHV